MRKHSQKPIWAAICAGLFAVLPPAVCVALAAERDQAVPPRQETASYSITLHYDAAQVRVSKVKLGDKSYIQLRDPAIGHATQEIGRPALPQDVVYVLLPEDAAKVRVVLDAASSVTVASGVSVMPLQPLMTTQRESVLKPQPAQPVAIDKEAYASSAPYPPEVATLQDVTTLFGATVAVIRVSPFVFNARAGRTELRTSLSGTVMFETAQPTRGLYPALSSAQRDALSRIVANPQALAAQAPSATVAPLTARADYVMSDLRPARHDTVNYVVIARAALAASFQPLVDWKTRKGVNARVVTVEWIAARYAGVDLANKVRNFIIDAHAKWGTSWVLLGGDVDQIPARLSTYDIHTSSYGPADLYYAGLGTNWNSNGNNIFGEGSEGDTYPDIFVGRAPVQNAAQVGVFIGKVLLYEKNPQAGYVERALLMGVSNNLGSDVDKEYNVRPLLPSSFTVKRMYDSASTLAPDYVLQQANAMAQLNSGYHILNHMDHSGIQSMGTGADGGGGGIDNADIDSLTNGLPGFVVWSYGCEPNAFDYDSISEHWMRNPNGGAVAFVGNTRTGNTGQSSQDIQFFNSWFTAKLRHLGTIFSTTQGPYGSYEADNMNLLGDPEMVVWNAQPTAMTLAGLGTIKTGPNALNLSVGGLVPGEEAVVTFRGPNGQIYAGGPTVGGALSGTLIVHTTPTLDLVVTSPDRTPLIASVPVGLSPGAHLYVSNLHILDTAGNSNHRLEPGESAILRVIVGNGGGAASVAGTATLATSTAGVTITAPVKALPSIAAAGTQTVNFPIVLTHAFSDGDPLLFSLTTNGAGIEGTNIHVPVYAPILEQTHTYDDSAGNGDGIPQAGETVKFALHVINNGFGDADALTATLTTSSPAITITDGSATVGNVPGKGSANSSDTFTLALGAAFNPNVDTVHLVMTDSLGNTTTKNIKLVVPAAPTGLGYRSTASSITALWDAAAVPLRNYKIYRSNAAAGPYAKIEPFLVRDGALYEDSAISAGQPSYFYRVSIVDASGNESAPAQIQAWTSLPVLSGFPRPIAPDDGVASGHTVAFDVDGDGKKEIFVTTSGGKLYAWNSSGNEFIPGGDPSFAEFATLDGASTGAGDYSNKGAPAFADIDNDGHTDIVVNGEYRVFAFHADGSPVAGWAGGVPLPKPSCMIDGPALFLTSPVVADLDGDGQKEIITTAFDWVDYCDGNRAHMYVFNRDGTLRPPYDIPDANYSFAVPAVADLNGDGKPELVVPVSAFINNNSVGQIYVLDSISSTFAPIVSVPGAAFHNEATLVDLDGDGQLDIVVPSQADGRVYAFHLTGTPVAGWAGGRPIDSGDQMVGSGPTIAAADLDCDGRPEIVLGTERKVYVWDHAGLPKSGWPVLRENKPGNQASGASPLIADVNGDGNLDVVISSSTLVDGGLIYAWDGRTGAPIAYFPQFIPEVIPRTGAVADLDGDGTLELIQATGSHVYVHKTTGHALASFTPWPNIDRDAIHSSAVPAASLGAPATAASNLIVSASGDRIFFIGTDSRVYTYVWNAGAGKWQLDWLGPAQRVGGGLIQGPPGGQVFFVGTDHVVYNYWKNAGQWQLDWLGPAANAAGNTVLNAAGDHLYFIGTDSRVYRYAWSATSQAWQLAALSPTQIAASNLVANASEDHLFFIGTDHRVYNFWKNGSQWQLDWLGPTANAASNLVLNAAGDHVYFIGTDARVYAYRWDGTSQAWQLAAMGPTPIAASDLIVNALENHLFFIGTDHRVYNFWKNGSQWQLDWLGPTANAAGNMILNPADDRLYYIGTDARVYGYEWNSTSQAWQVAALSPNPIAASNLAINPSGDHLFFIGTDHRVYNFWKNGSQWQLDWLCQ